MKKLLFLFVFISFFTSCSDDVENIVDVDESELVGTWNLTKFDFNGTTTAISQGVGISGSSKSFGKNYDFTLTFNETPQEYTTNGSFTLVATSTIAGQTQTVEQETSSVSELSSGLWKVENGKIVFTDSDIISSITIDSFADNKLILKQNIDESETEQGILIKVKGTAIIVFER